MKQMNTTRVEVLVFCPAYLQYIQQLTVVALLNG